LENPKKINQWRVEYLSTRGRKPQNLKKTMEGILWVMRTGSPWRDIPKKFGIWSQVYAQFRSWSKNGLWSYLLKHFEDNEADKEYLMIDSSVVRVHQDATRYKNDPLAEAIGRSKGGISTKIHFICDALGYPISFILTGGERGDATQATALLDKTIQPGCSCLLDKGYDSDDIRTFIVQKEAKAIIPYRKNRTKQPEIDNHLYKERHKVENLFQKLKRFRRIHSRFEMKTSSYAAMISIASICVWILQ